MEGPSRCYCVGVRSRSLRYRSALAIKLMARRVAADEEKVMVTTETTSAAQAVAIWTDLTPSEREVGAAMARGWTNPEIARRLGLSPKTVDNRVSAIYEKLPDLPGVHRRAVDQECTRVEDPFGTRGRIASGGTHASPILKGRRRSICRCVHARCPARSRFTRRGNHDDTR